MILKEFLGNRLKHMGLNLSESELEEFKFLVDLDLSLELKIGDVRKVELALMDYIVSLLAMPSISESGFSISPASEQNIRGYYAYLSQKYKVENKLNPKPKIRFYE